MNIEDRLLRILPRVEKPARYIGGEWNQIRKDARTVRTRFALAFPDTYEIGMSHSGLRILYDLLNRREDIAAERVFAPWTDMEARMREEGMPLYSLESKIPLSQFDIIGFSLMHELCYTNVLNMLDLSGIPIRAAERGVDRPLIVAGGTCTLNPEPISDFIDLFVVGDGEEIIFDITDLYMSLKLSGKRDKREILLALAQIPGVYAPLPYETQEDPRSGMLVPRKTAGLPYPVRRRILFDINKYSFPSNPIVPFTDIVFDRASVELFRGCERGCRFCQAGIVYRPTRERDPLAVYQAAVEQVDRSGYEEISLNSLSSGDYSRLPQLLSMLNSRFRGDCVALSLSSLFPSSLTPEVIRQIKQVRKTGFTMAPEGGTERMRRVINKYVSEEEILSAAELVYGEGWEHIKLYFMIGQPTETMEDVVAIVDLTKKISAIGRKYRGSGSAHLGVSSFVPKPHTAFQWCAMDTRESLLEKQATIRRMTERTRIRFKWHNINISTLDSVFSRGDRRLNRVLELAFRKGCRFDSWSDCTHFPLWEEAFAEAGVDPRAYQGPYGADWTLPWDHISSGVSKKFLREEWEKALRMEITPISGFDNCTLCGACKTSDLAFLRGQAEEARNLPLPETRIEGPRQETEKNFRYRASFQKLGNLRFISHLDLTRALRLAFKRADVPVSYSRGFHPQPHVSFGPALPMSVESREEFLDFFTFRAIRREEFLRAINGALPPELAFRDMAALPKNAPSLSVVVDGADYTVRMNGEPACLVRQQFARSRGIAEDQAMCVAIRLFEEKQDIPFIRFKSEKVINIKNFVRSVRYDPAGELLHVEMKIVNGATVGIQQVIRALLCTEWELPITRESQYVWNGGQKTSPLHSAWEEMVTRRQIAELTM